MNFVDGLCLCKLSRSGEKGMQELVRAKDRGVVSDQQSLCGRLFVILFGVVFLSFALLAGCGSSRRDIDWMTEVVEGYESGSSVEATPWERPVRAFESVPPGAAEKQLGRYVFS